MSANVLLVSDTIIKERTSIHGNIDPKLIYPEIKFAQDSKILPILGTALYEKLQTLISDGTIISDVANADYKDLLDKYIIDALMYYTLAELPINLSFQIWNKGVVRKQGQDTELPSMSEIVAIGQNFQKKAEYYGNRLKLYVIQNANAKFKEYLNPGSTIDTVVPEQNTFTMPMFLGNIDDDFNSDYNKENPYNNRGGFNGQPYKE
jgi:hypothetical protein